MCRHVAPPSANISIYPIILIIDPFTHSSTPTQPPGGPLDDYCISDGRIVSGVNPASAASTAELTISVFEQLVV